MGFLTEEPKSFDGLGHLRPYDQPPNVRILQQEDVAFLPDPSVGQNDFYQQQPGEQILDPNRYSNPIQDFPPGPQIYDEVFGTINDLAGRPIHGASDVGISDAMASFGFNIIIFIVLMLTFEVVSRIVPTVYAGRKLHVTQDQMLIDLPVLSMPLSWVPTVAKTSWKSVRKCGGLDAYFFLRFIRMCLQITLVSGLWAISFLWPIFATGNGHAVGWYHFSMSNVTQGDWRIWCPAIFMWFFSFYIFYVMSQEYKHYLELRIQFLAEGDGGIETQVQHSLLVEEIPQELRSDNALYSYFDTLFPGKVHSASVVLDIPDLEKIASKRKRAVRRLEKSQAFHEATGKRATHVIGRKRWRCCGIETFPLISIGGKMMEDDVDFRSPQRGERVDSSNYYRKMLDELNETVERLQEEKKRQAEEGNDSMRASEWLSRMISMASDAAAQTLTMNSRDEDESGLLLEFKESRRCCGLIRSLGVDFLFGGLTLFNRNIGVVVDAVGGSTMSSTGFVTFNDLTTVSCASKALLSHNSDNLKVKRAPEPRDLIWENAHVNLSSSSGRSWTANFFIGFGALLWSIPVASIQAFATVDNLANIPGMSWASTLSGGKYSSFLNGYLPVVALLSLISILPIIFQSIALNFESRKTKTDVQESMLGRYFNYQLANIYITVTAGSLWSALATIIDHPGAGLEILGNSVPTVVGYFVTLLMTKTLAGLPMVLLRVGALLRRIFLTLVFRQKYLTQREIDEVYKRETMLAGWEYPNQLLVIVICFTYACISPIILPVGALYFFGALIVYKKHVLMVYAPDFESGGTMFPTVCVRTLVGLICGQVTLIGYTVLRGGIYQPLLLIPLPFVTYIMMQTFERRHVEPSFQLSLERAQELDQDSMVKIRFTEDFYRQPVLTEEPKLDPLPYRVSGTASPRMMMISRHELGVLHNESGSKIV